MSSAQITVRIDKTVKDEATMLFRKMGIDQSTAINMFYRQTIAERKLPFQPVAETTRELLSRTLLELDSKDINVECDEDGALLIDEELHPELYDWIVSE